ncbi:uroporphyrinogen decarboxylase family protein [Desulfosarcina ovata]|uniref:Uroporphyrinogen decarboxylase n=1 Tax=Desulfosarcina ovata subsp. ovata TaxID=2752305 RepID=A0A5K8AFW2_9BACT|nr:uroporphyrinogen decarboxylase family protein [Desulfosarcina ovata]BBO91409.1 uroporphyrinogen decarboxylase [Desulfosarcina ovata subsp. ovata]
MLTKKQNLLETIKGGNPDRFVNQYEFLEIITEAPKRIRPTKGETILNEWGITLSWPEDQIGPFPVHDDEHRALKDITKWKEIVKVPSVEFSDEVWAPAIEHAKAVDRDDQYVAVFFSSGTFEMTHYLMGMEDAMMGLYEEPECMHELIECLTDYEIHYAEQIIERLKPNALFHHDDWGGQISTFLSPDMFKEFYLEPYKRAYKFWRDNGIELIVHHSDSYAATLVPYMIEMGVDIWQGVMTTNNTPELIKTYGGQISFMGELDSGPLDVKDWDAKLIEEHVEKACTSCGKHYFIPCLTQGLNFSSFPGVYDAASKAIDKMSKKMF